jgi:phage gp36-like protein
MSYTTDLDLVSLMPERTLIQLSADDPLAAEPDWSVVAEARAYADGQLDARLRQRYGLPLASVPRELRDWALALARRWLYERRPDGPELPGGVRDAAQGSPQGPGCGPRRQDVPGHRQPPPAKPWPPRAPASR